MIETVAGGDEKHMHERLRKLRRTLDLTQQSFGNRISVKGNTVAQWESGRNEPSDAIVRSICREFNASEEWLRTGQGDMFVKQTRNQQLAKLTKQLLTEEEDSFKNRLISVLSNLTESQWQTLADIADALANEKS